MLCVKLHLITMQTSTKSKAFIVSGIAAMVGGIVLTFIRSGGPFTGTLVSYGLARGLGLWIFGAIAVAFSKPENAQRNGILVIIAALALNLVSVMAAR
jgi:hypothetical protein